MNILLKMVVCAISVISVGKTADFYGNWRPKMPGGAHGWRRGFVCALVAENILPGCGTSDYKLKKPYLIPKRKLQRFLELSKEFIPTPGRADGDICMYLGRFYGGEFKDDFWFINDKFTRGWLKIENWDDYSKEVDERLEMYRQRRNLHPPMMTMKCIKNV